MKLFRMYSKVHPVNFCLCYVFFLSENICSYGFLLNFNKLSKMYIGLNLFQICFRNPFFKATIENVMYFSRTKLEGKGKLCCMLVICLLATSLPSIYACDRCFETPTATTTTMFVRSETLAVLQKSKDHSWVFRKTQKKGNFQTNIVLHVFLVWWCLLPPLSLKPPPPSLCQTQKSRCWGVRAISICFCCCCCCVNDSVSRTCVWFNKYLSG